MSMELESGKKSCEAESGKKSCEAESGKKSCEAESGKKSAAQPLESGKKQPREQSEMGAYNRLEKPLLRVSFVLFLALHLAALLVIPLFKPVSVPEEISIDIDLLPDSVALDHAPAAKQPEPINILPQLPKKFTLQKPMPLPIDPEPAPELAEAKPTPVDKQPVEDTIERTTPSEENVLKVSEALQRLALEKLRSQKHKETKRDATISNKIQKAIASINKLKDSGTLTTNYQTALRVAIKRNFILPDIYDLKNANIEVKLEIRIDARGNLLRMRVLRSSRNRVFDDLAMAAVRNTSPFPIPPMALVDKQIIVILTPLMTG